MIVSEFVEAFGLKIAAGDKGLSNEIMDGFCCDLLSEVMGNAPEGSLWMTVHGHQNIVGVGVLRDMAAVVITGGHEADPETIKKANKENIPVLLYEGTTFQLSCKLFSKGIGS
jgi:predicted transcriptional regulator